MGKKWGTSGRAWPLEEMTGGREWKRVGSLSDRKGDGVGSWATSLNGEAERKCFVPQQGDGAQEAKVPGFCIQALLASRAVLLPC